jgi:hypothetical protein
MGAVAANGCHPQVQTIKKLNSELSSDDLSSCAQGIQLVSCHTTRQGGHAAIGAGAKFICVDKLKRLAQRCSDFLRGFDGIACHIDGPDHDFLTSNKFQKIHWDMRIVAFEGDHTDAGFLQLGESFLILPPF